MNTLPLWFLIAQPIVTAAIAIVGAFFAWVQLRAASQKFALDLFERRMKVAIGVSEIVRLTLAEARVEDDAHRSMLELGRDARFVFGDEVVARIRALADLLSSIRIAQGDIGTLQHGDRRTTLTRTRDRDLVAASQEYERLFRSYSRYMWMDVKIVRGPREFWRDLRQGREEETDLSIRR